jgi:hypothetical protein
MDVSDLERISDLLAMLRSLALSFSRFERGELHSCKANASDRARLASVLACDLASGTVIVNNDAVGVDR